MKQDPKWSLSVSLLFSNPRSTRRPSWERLQPSDPVGVSENGPSTNTPVMPFMVLQILR